MNRLIEVRCRYCGRSGVKAVPTEERKAICSKECWERAPRLEANMRSVLTGQVYLDQITDEARRPAPPVDQENQPPRKVVPLGVPVVAALDVDINDPALPSPVRTAAKAAKIPIRITFASGFLFNQTKDGQVSSKPWTTYAIRCDGGFGIWRVMPSGKVQTECAYYRLRRIDFNTLHKILKGQT